MIWYKRFKEPIQQLSLDASSQMKMLEGTVVADEIVSDFCDIGMIYAKKLFENQLISECQMELALAIEKKFESMSLKKGLWTNEALFESLEWKECRSLGKKLLKTLE